MSIYGSVILYTNAPTDAALNAIEEFRNVAPFEEWMEAWRCEPPRQLSEVIFDESDRERTNGELAGFAFVHLHDELVRWHVEHGLQ